jgi:hypothetical protein
MIINESECMGIHYTRNLHIQSKLYRITTEQTSGRKEMKVLKNEPTRCERKSRGTSPYYQGIPERKKGRRALTESTEEQCGQQDDNKIHTWTAASLRE